MRKFIRHPACIPIEVAVVPASLAGQELVELTADGDDVQQFPEQLEPPTRMINISGGGLAFVLAQPVDAGDAVSISMPEVWPSYRACGTVVWCRDTGEGYEAGVQFRKADEAFKARMVAQFCQIEDYRRLVGEREGRELSSEEAAREWIVQYAEEFADTIGWQ